MFRDDFWGELNLAGVITIASRMKRLSDLLYQQVQEIYDWRCREFKSSWFAILATIKKEGKIDFKTLASKNNISSSAVSQAMRDLEKLELVNTEFGQDRRSRLISLSEKGHKALEKIAPDLLDIERLLYEIIGDDSESLIDTLNRVETLLRKKTFKELLNIYIDNYRDEYKDDFEKLNTKWIDHYFTQEKYDNDLFADPKKMIIDKGGEIFFILQNKKVIGTIALIPCNETELEMSKMTVIESHRKRGIAKMLLDKAIDYAKENSYRRILAFTNTKLDEAINFYKKHGFTGVEFKDPRYERVDSKYTLEL